MRTDDLDLRELLEFDPKGGLLHFAGRRAVLQDVEALGLLRSELVQTIGPSAARGVLARSGFAHGWRAAQSLANDVPWHDEREWRLAGTRLHTLQGMALADVVRPRRNAGDGTPLLLEGSWRESFEAEQHVAMLGRSRRPVCWSLCGFASGYASAVTGRTFYWVEDRCTGCGDAACHVVGRYAEDWGEALPEIESIYRHESLDELRRTEARLRRTQRALAAREPGDEIALGIIARSDSMKRLVELARRVARVDSTVLVTGESGSGKERVARLIHDESARATGPFIAVNCAAMSEGLLESELFGHVRGAFTGASQDRPGLFEAAQGGTLFLDEVGEVPPAMQAKLLRALQEREVRRLGENHSRKLDVRIVAATNRNLGEEVGAGRYRRDLLFRLRVVELRLPPLRDRREDVLPLARAMLERAAVRHGLDVRGLSAAAADQLLRHDWPGNVRELENAIERAVALSSGERVELEDLPEEVRLEQPAAAPRDPVRRLDEVERDHILGALEANGGHQARTAAQLGIGPATLYRKLKAYGRLGHRSSS